MKRYTVALRHQSQQSPVSWPKYTNYQYAGHRYLLNGLNHSGCQCQI